MPNMEYKATGAPVYQEHHMGLEFWKSICKLWEEFSQHKQFAVGKGHHVRFWKDKWLCNTILMDDCPALIQLACHPDSSKSQNRDGTIWSIMFRRNLQIGNLRT